MILNEIREINRKVENYLKDNLKDYNISIGQWELIKMIFQSVNLELNAQTLEKQLKVDKRTLSINLAKLEKQGLILRGNSEEDRRKKQIMLTDYTMEVAEDLLSIEKEINETIIQLLEDKEKFNQELNSLNNGLWD